MGTKVLCGFYKNYIMLGPMSKELCQELRSCIHGLAYEYAESELYKGDWYVTVESCDSHSALFLISRKYNLLVA